MTFEKLEIGQKYSKKELAKILENKNIATIREGIYNLNESSSLFFVDLEKKGKEDRFHFDDYFDGDYFHWDSQTTQHIGTPRIKEIIAGIRTPHLFVRIMPLVNNQVQPFIYCGKLKYVDFVEGTSKPVHLIFHSLDFQIDTENIDLKQIYSWRPTIIGKSSKYNLTNGRLIQDHIKRRLKKPKSTKSKARITIRVGQEYHRQQMINKWGGKCPVTGCSIQKILISSHIVPWSQSNDTERLDVENGILLSPNVDALFDKHLISFSDDGLIILSSKIEKSELHKLGIDLKVKINISEGMKPYLKRHRKNL